MFRIHKWDSSSLRQKSMHNMLEKARLCITIGRRWSQLYLSISFARMLCFALWRRISHVNWKQNFFSFFFILYAHFVTLVFCLLKFLQKALSAIFILLWKMIVIKLTWGYAVHLYVFFFLCACLCINFESYFFTIRKYRDKKAL